MHVLYVFLGSTVQDVERTIAATSTEAVRAKLLKDYSTPGKVNSKRDKIVDYCKLTFLDFPKVKP
jgi:hypothetical protein